jgi:asparagine synthase (glutamine-hydrolysing)
MNPRLETRVEWGGVAGSSLRALVGAQRVRLDPDGVRAAFGEIEPTGATCILGARRVWPALAREAGTGSLRGPLTEACANIPAGSVALALSGGVDSAVLAALLRGRAVAYTLAPALPGYSEASEAQRIADGLGIALRRVVVTEDELIAALPAVIRACECPLYNLHPVSRYLLAKAVRADGHDVLITGDGADEVFRGTSGADYLPIVGALTRAAGMVAFAPFLATVVASSVAADPDKRALRGLACELGVPEAIAWAPKTPRFAPPMDLARHRDVERIAALGRSLGTIPTDTTDRERVSWTTLALFADEFAGLDLSCAA